MRPEADPQPPAAAPPVERVPADERRRILTQALSIAVAVSPFGVVFGLTCTKAGLDWKEALGFSTLVFGGSSQFAAVSVLRDGGTAVAAILAGALLNVRSVAFGVVMAPDLDGPWWQRALASQLMIDESMAVGSAQRPGRRRFGYVAAGIAVFVLWNATTLIGALVVANAGDTVRRLGADATIPAAFLALLWPRLREREPCWRALLGALIALACVPWAPAGTPILAAAAAALVPLPARLRRSPGAAR